MFIPPVALGLNMMQLAYESNLVIGLRLMTLGAGGQKAAAEAQLMIAEKMKLASLLTIENAFALAQGQSIEKTQARSVSRYLRVVQANRRRLSK
ncbi:MULTISPECIES: hypothetical protein [unclassified Rhizobium]|uniref:hypothetical protein n=1 Tax=unclassified Rhizobium TaxID=2613769 RepID=UPI001603FDD0|nr:MULTISPECIES: hypothetical protein [unclassified Rhizobium]MBB1249435.1 hypothetical protein [Rhizobium sp. G21]MCV3768496.1 hypothetical protein [Rhizobium sp. TRM95796]